MPPRMTQAIRYTAVAVAAVATFSPFSVALATLPLIQFLPAALIVLAVSSYGWAYSQGIPGTLGMTLTMGLWMIAIVHDVVRTTVQLGAAHAARDRALSEPA